MKAAQAKRRKALAAANGALHLARELSARDMSLSAIARTFNESDMTTQKGEALDCGSSGAVAQDGRRATV